MILKGIWGENSRKKGLSGYEEAYRKLITEKQKKAQ